MLASQRIDEESNEDDEGEDDILNQYNKLKQEKFEKEEKIKKLEKDYLKKISELLIMIQVHCEIKDDMYKKFEASCFREDKK